MSDVATFAEHAAQRQAPGAVKVRRPGDWLESGAVLLKEPDPGPTPFLVEELITEAAIAALQGFVKVGKTWLVLELAVAITTGVPAFDRFAVPQPGPVIAVFEESGRNPLHRRLDKLSRGHNLRPEALGDLHLAANRRVRLDDGGWKSSILAAAKEIKPRAVLLDPLVRLKGSSVNENVQQEMAPAFEFMRDLRDESGAAVVFVHHTGHENKDRMRGSSDLEALWESKLILTRDKKSGINTLVAEHREAEAMRPFEYVLRPHDESETISLAPTGGRPREDVLVQRVIKYVEQNPGQLDKEIRAGVGRRLADVRSALESGKALGTLWKCSGESGTNGNTYRRGAWYPAADGGSQPELSVPAAGNASEGSHSAGEAFRSSAPKGAAPGTLPDGRDATGKEWS